MGKTMPALHSDYFTTNYCSGKCLIASHSPPEFTHLVILRTLLDPVSHQHDVLSIQSAFRIQT